jgi:PleD family two-component response regulator
MGSLVRDRLTFQGSKLNAKPIILIADRSKSTLRRLRNARLNGDFKLLHATDERNALSIVDNYVSHIAVAVIELELPVVNGLNLIGRLTWKRPKPIKIIATTFLEHEPLFEIARYMGADAIVRKALHKETLIETLEGLLPEVMEWSARDLAHSDRTRV